MKTGPIVLACLIALSTGAVALVQSNGWTLYYGDAEAHLAIARRVVDSRTPGYDQIGTVWLPLPHFLMLPFVANNWLWRAGLAGAIPSAACWVGAGWFLFAASRRALGSVPASCAALACFAANPNMLYLQSIPMTEAVFAVCLLALLYSTVAFTATQKLRFVSFAGLAALAGSLTRYEGWFLIPSVTLFFLLASHRRRVATAVLFGAIASAGPLYWLAHNWWYFGDALDFYRGPYSPQAIQGGRDYPGLHDWAKSWLYYRSTVALTAGWGLLVVGVVGLFAALGKRQWWPLFLLALPPSFYVWSMHSTSAPIFIPTLWPNTYYNSRYGLAALPLLAFLGGASVLLFPTRLRPRVAAAVLALSILPWLWNPRPDAWVCWKESQVNSIARRAWTFQSAQFLAAHYQSGSGIFSTIGDMAGAFRDAGIPFRDVLQEGNEPAWQSAVARPDLFLNEQWAVSLGDDAIGKSAQAQHYELAKSIDVKDAPVVRIFKRN